VEVDDGYPALAHFKFRHSEANAVKTLFTQLMLERGFLATTGIYVTLAHTDTIIDRYLRAVDNVFETLARAIEEDTVLDRLRGPVAHTGFRRLL
jgi:glutamate-1-semialdehyde 2,1-aminomutase